MFGKAAMDLRWVFHVLKKGFVGISFGGTRRSGFARWSLWTIVSIDSVQRTVGR